MGRESNEIAYLVDYLKEIESCRDQRLVHVGSGRDVARNFQSSRAICR